MDVLAPLAYGKAIQQQKAIVIRRQARNYLPNSNIHSLLNYHYKLIMLILETIFQNIYLKSLTLRLALLEYYRK